MEEEGRGVWVVRVAEGLEVVAMGMEAMGWGEVGAVAEKVMVVVVGMEAMGLEEERAVAVVVVAVGMVEEKEVVGGKVVVEEAERAEGMERVGGRGAPAEMGEGRAWEEGAHQCRAQGLTSHYHPHHQECRQALRLMCPHK